MSYVVDGYWLAGYAAPAAASTGQVQAGTFLGLCQMVRQLGGISGEGPSTVNSQVGEYRRIVDWVAQAWLEIQKLHPDWMWAWDTFDFTTNAGVSDTTLVASGRVQLDTLRLNGGALVHTSYSSVRDAPESFGVPRGIATLPNGRYRLLPTPDASHVIRGEYYMAPQILINSTDVPRLPSEHHRAIVYRALMHYGAYEAATDVYQNALAEYARCLTALELDQLPDMTLPGGLA